MYPTGPSGTQQPRNASQTSYGTGYGYGYGVPLTRPLPSMIRTYSDERAYHIDLQWLAQQGWQVVQVTPVSQGSGGAGLTLGCGVAPLALLTLFLACAFAPLAFVTGFLAIVVGIVAVAQGAGGGRTGYTVTYVAPYGVTPHPALAPGSSVRGGELLSQILDAPLPQAFELAVNRLSRWYGALSTGWKVAVATMAVGVLLAATVGINLIATAH